MDGARKVLGVFLLVCLGVPLFVATQLAVSVTSAVFSEEFLEKVPQQAVEEFPEAAEEFYALSEETGSVKDPDARAWLAALHKAEPSASNFLKESGIQGWLDTEVQPLIKQVIGVLKGELQPQDISIDLRPLKKGLNSDYVKGVANRTLEALPPCDAVQTTAWRLMTRNPKAVKKLPPCNPGFQQPALAVEIAVQRLSRFPDEHKVFQGEKELPGVNAFSWVNSLMWLLLLFPISLILIFSAVGGGKSFLVWSGVTGLASALFLYIIGKTMGAPMLSAMSFRGQDLIPRESQPWMNTAAGEAVAARISKYAEFVMQTVGEHIATSAMIVGAVSVAVVVLGILLARKG